MAKSTFLKLLAIFVLIFVGTIALNGQHAYAATFDVNYTGDDSDASPGDGFCDAGEGACSLRAAIEEANALSGADVIHFDIAGSGVHTITPSTSLPSIDETLTINGLSQSGASCGTLVPTSLPASSNTPHVIKIAINASGGARGLDVESDGVVIEGLAVYDATDTNIYEDAADATISCNHIGVDAAGNIDQVTPRGVQLDTEVATVQNNIISGNNTGILDNSPGNVIQDNIIGLAPNGLDPLPNTGDGIFSNWRPVIDHNVIADNDHGINLQHSEQGFSATGNYIGLNIAGSPVGNRGSGINVYSSRQFTIGSAAPGGRNVISGNDGDGIHIFTECNGGSSFGGTVYNNYIGTDTTGNVADGYGNGQAGVEVNEFHGVCVSVYRHQIGGVDAGQPNTIAGNDAQGVLIHQSFGTDVFSISVLGNSIFRNGGLNIDLASDSNDAYGVADTDLGQNPQNTIGLSYPTTDANNYLNSPIINEVTSSGDQLTINYDFNAPVVTSSDDTMKPGDLVGFKLDFYANGGKDHIGSFIVDGSETSAEHTFTTASTSNIVATATVLWTIKSQDDCNIEDTVFGVGPPYQGCPV